MTSNRDGNFGIYETNSNGSVPVRLTNHGAFDGNPRYSPDGAKIAFEATRDGDSEIYIINSDGSGTPVNLTGGAADTISAWSPGGTRTAFTSTRDGNFHRWSMNADGSMLENITDDSFDDVRPSLTAGGN